MKRIPDVIVADLDVMRTAPAWMVASGFADLMAKETKSLTKLLEEEEDK